MPKKKSESPLLPGAIRVGPTVIDFAEEIDEDAVTLVNIKAPKDPQVTLTPAKAPPKSSKKPAKAPAKKPAKAATKPAKKAPAKAANKSATKSKSAKPKKAPAKKKR